MVVHELLNKLDLILGLSQFKLDLLDELCGVALDYCPYVGLCKDHNYQMNITCTCNWEMGFEIAQLKQGFMAILHLHNDLLICA